MTPTIAPLPLPDPTPVRRTARFRLDDVSDEALHAGVKTLAGRYNVLTADLLAHLAEVDARGIYRERACSSLYTYCVYELRLSEDEAQRRARAARAARTFPVLFEMLAEGAIHLTGLLLLAPHLTEENHAELLARARFRTKREIEHLVAEIAPRADVPARIEPLGSRRPAVRNLWQAFTASLRGPVRELVPGVGAGEAPPADFVDKPPPPERVEALPNFDDDASAPARVAAPPTAVASEPCPPLRYRVEFTASQRYVELLEEARNLLQHQVPNRDVARVHELAMAAFVEQLRKRRQAASDRPGRAASRTSVPGPVTRAGDAPAPERVDTPDSDRPAPERVTRVGESDAAHGRYVPAEIRRAVWRRDEARCTFLDASGRRCHERAGLELHHDHALALGGQTTLENLRLVCRAHNALFAERDFGRGHVERMKSAR